MDIWLQQTLMTENTI